MFSDFIKHYNIIRDILWDCLSNNKARVHSRTHYMTPEQAQKENFKYIKLYYNTKRIHSSLGYLFPSQFEKQN